MSSVLSINDRIRQLMKVQELPQVRLAELINIERSHLSRLLSGSRTWQIEQLERVAAAFQLSHSSLVEGTDAEGLDAERASLEQANQELRDQVGQRIAEVQVLLTKVTALEDSEREMRAQRDEANARLEQQSVECDALRRRPTLDVHEAVCVERDEWTARCKSLGGEVHAARKQLSISHRQLSDLKLALERSHTQVLTNYRAAEHWRKVAYQNGQVLKGAAFAAAGLGFLSLLGGGEDDE